MGAVGDPARRLRQDGRRARRRRRARRSCRARSTGRASGSASRSSRPDRSPICCSRSLLFAGTFMAGIPGQRAVLADAPPGTPAAAAGVRAGDLVVAVDGEPVTQLAGPALAADQGAGARRGSAGDRCPRGRAGDPPVTRVLSLGSCTPADWEGNALGHARPARRSRAAADRRDSSPASRAKRAGLAAGDRIVAIDGTPVRSPGDVATITNAKPGVPLVFRRRARRRDATTSR